MNYHVVTTTNAQGWEQTGKRMAESFLANWPVPLTLYAEDFEPEPMEGLEVRKLPAWLDEFKREHERIPAHCGMRAKAYTFRHDAVKFAHKVAALTDFALAIDEGIVIWLDADTFTHAPVTVGWLDGLFPGTGYIAWLDRLNCYPECGFVMYRASHPYHRTFMDSFRQTYITGSLFKMSETHDSFVLQTLVNKKVAMRKIERPVSLSGEARNWHHPLCAGPLGKCLDHAKGNRKNEGRSPKIDARGRPEPHWAS